MSKAKLTVFFEEPFWVGLYEREDGGQYEVSKVTFGAEPKDYEVYAYFLANFYTLRLLHSGHPARTPRCSWPWVRSRFEACSSADKIPYILS